MIRVLQQIAVGYVLAFFLLPLRPSLQAAAAVLFLAAHTAAHLAYGSYHGIDPWNIKDNFGFWLDRQMDALFNQWGNPVILPPPRGNYAQFNAISSTATIIFGVLAGELLRGGLSAGRQVLVLLVAGAAGLAGGLALSGGWEMNGGIPAVKRIWTASFGIFAAGWTCLMLAAFHGVTEGLRWRKWAFPFAVAGMNSIALYFMSGTLRRPIESALRPFTEWKLKELSVWGPVVLACLVTLMMWGMCHWLYRRRIFFKV
jgi:predicted acyltransferase